MREYDQLSFGQREGIDPLPSPLDKKNLSPELRNALWNLVYESMCKTMHRGDGFGHPATLGENWRNILLSYHKYVENKATNKFTNVFDRNETYIEEIISNHAWGNVIGFLEHVICHRDSPYQLESKINYTIKKFLYPYRIIENRFIPAASEEEAQSIQNAFSALQENRMVGAQKHLILAAENFTKGDYNNSINESISAVESVAKIILNNKGTTLGTALTQLEQNDVITHNDLKQGFSKIYNYTNDAENNIRHAIFNKEAEIYAEDAQFMLGACASFVNYLLSKAVKAGIDITQTPLNSDH